MKPIIILTAACIIAAQSAQAQFLNKIKQKAAAALEKAVDGKNNTGNNNQRPDYGVSREDKNAFNAEQYGHAAMEFQNGETLVYGEHSLRIQNNQTVVKAITKLNNQFFFYENDKRSGPFSTPPVEKLDNRMHDPYAARGNEEKHSDWNPYLSKGILTVDGKNYGEVMMMHYFYYNKAKKKFYAVITRNENGDAKFYLVTEKGSRKIPLPSNSVYISDDDETGGVMVTATQFNAKNMDEMIKYVPNDDNYILLANGTNIGPLKAVQADVSYIDNYGHFIEVSRSTKAVYSNGKTIFSFGADNGNSEGRFYAARSAESGAWFEHGSLYFSDGTRIINYVMQPAVSVENGKEVINWLSIQNHKLYVCKKDL